MMAAATAAEEEENETAMRHFLLFPQEKKKKAKYIPAASAVCVTLPTCSTAIQFYVYMHDSRLHYNPRSREPGEREHGGVEVSREEEEE